MYCFKNFHTEFEITYECLFTVSLRYYTKTACGMSSVRLLCAGTSFKMTTSASFFLLGHLTYKI